MRFKFKPCAFEKWARFDSWPVQQAAFILMGHEPPPLLELLTGDYDSAYGLKWRHLLDGSRDHLPEHIFPTHQIWEVVIALRDMARALGLAIPNDSIPFRRITEHGYIVIHVKPADVVRWAQGKKFSIPPELEVLFSEEPKSDSAVLPAKTSVLKTYPISDLVGRVCSQGELEEAIDSEELPVCVRLTRVPAYSESGETTHTAPGIYRLQPDDGKSLLPSAGQEGRRFALYSCYPEPNPDRLVFHFRAGTPAAPPPISYADLRVTHSDLVAWCEDKGKRPEWLFGKSPTQADPKEPVSQLPETALTKLPANSLYRIIGVLVMLLAIDPQSKKPLSKKDVATQNKVKQRYTHDTGNINRSAILRDIKTVMEIVCADQKGVNKNSVNTAINTALPEGLAETLPEDLAEEILTALNLKK